MLPNPSTKVIELHERESRLFPRSELFNASGQSLILSETRSLAAIDLRDTADGVELRVLGVIGMIPLTADVVLNLRPKFPLSNLWTMVEAADEACSRFLPVLKTYEDSSLDAPSRFLVRAFCYYLREILRLGIARGYESHPHNGYYVPKVNISRTITTRIARGDQIHVASDRFSLSSNLRVNRLLKSAILDFGSRIPRDNAWKPENEILLDALLGLDSVLPERLQHPSVFAARSVPIWLRDAYKGALTVYDVLRGHTKIGFGIGASGSSLPSFLFSMDSIFESFVRNTLRAELLASEISVVDGNRPKHQSCLFVDNRTFPIKPDLIFRKGGKTLAIGDVKYKPRIDESDRYQVISHTVASGAKLGFWISPAVSTHGMEYVGAISTGARFFHYRFDLQSDIKASRRKMIEEITKILTD